jgi:hypothetical protein
MSQLAGHSRRPQPKERFIWFPFRTTFLKDVAQGNTPKLPRPHDIELVDTSTKSYYEIPEKQRTGYEAENHTTTAHFSNLQQNGYQRFCQQPQPFGCPRAYYRQQVPP